MRTITLFHDRESSVSILTWGGSLIFHGLLILGTFTFLTQVTPTPASERLPWKVSLVPPGPSPELSEHAQTVKHSQQPTTRSTVSRPQPKRHLVQQRRIQQRQPSVYQTAAVTRPAPQPVNNHVPTQAMLSHSVPSPRSLPKRVTHIQATLTRQAISTTRVMAETTPLLKKQHLNRKAEIRTVKFAQPQVISATAVTHSAPSSRKTEPTSGKIQQRSESSMPRSHRPQQDTSVVKQRVSPVAKQPAIFAGAPKRQITQKLHHRTKLASISREAMQSRQKRHSDNSQISKGLSKEVLTFLKLLREKIEKSREYPRRAKRLGYQGTTTISFALSHAGKLTLLKIAEPSGHTILDEAALKAVQSISTLKPPMSIGGTPIEIPVAFELTR